MDPNWNRLINGHNHQMKWRALYFPIYKEKQMKHSIKTNEHIMFCQIIFRSLIRIKLNNSIGHLKFDQNNSQSIFSIVLNSSQYNYSLSVYFHCQTEIFSLK